MAKTKNYRIIILCLMFIITGAIFVLAQKSEAAFTYQPMEKIPGFEDVDITNLPNLLTSIYKFGIWTIGIAALFMITIGGFTYMTSAGNTSTAGTGKKMITDAVIGLVLALIAVLLFTVINPEIVKINLQIAPVSVAPTTPGGPTLPGGPPPSSGGLATNPNNLVCTYNGVDQAKVNVCTALTRPGGCGGSNCAQYLSFINKYASGSATIEVLKMFMVLESDCDITKASSSSYGLMQINPSTINLVKYKSLRDSCGATGTIDKAWLTDSANAEKSICLAAGIIKNISTQCGSDIKNLYAGYNAGAGNCAQSVDCATDQSCSGSGTMKKWECPFDNNKTTCNVGSTGTGMQETRQAAMYINYCSGKLGF